MGKSFNYKPNHFPKSKFVFLSAIAVFIGGLIYILLRPVEPDFLHWFDAIGIKHWLLSAREKSLSIRVLLPQWVVYSLPNGLWAFAYTLIVSCIWAGSNSFLKYFWFLSIPVLVLGMELLQLTEGLQGTFCLNDIASSIIGITVGFIIFHKESNSNRFGIDHDNELIAQKNHNRLHQITKF